MTLPIVTNPAPVASWNADNLDINGNLVPAGEISGYMVGIRDLAATGSAVGTYPNTASTNATTVAEALSLLYTSGAMVAGHDYAVAVKTLAATPPGPSAWSAEYQFTWQPIAAPAAPTGLTVA